MSRLSREGIAKAAIGIADEEGVDAVSMRRVATGLGVGTMSLYHYVDTKEDLVALMGDAIISEFVIPTDEMPAGWRPGLREIAMRTKATYDRHPWILSGMLRGGDDPPGPSLMRHAEQTLSTVAGLGLSPEDRFHVTGLVDEFVMGYVFREQVERGEVSEPGFRSRMSTWFVELLGSGDYPHFTSVFELEDPTPDEVWEFFERLHGADRFERGLDTVLDGIEVFLSRPRS